MSAELETPVRPVKTPQFVDYLISNMQDILLTTAVVLMSVLASMPKEYLGGVDRTYLIGAITGILVVGLIKHLKLALVLLVIAIVIGINLPSLILEELGINSWALIAVLCFMVIVASVNKFVQVPKWLDPKEEAETFASRLHGTKAMFGAIKAGRVSSVRAILKQGIDPNILSEIGDTPLIAATKNQNQHIVQLLLDNKADYTIQNDEGKTAFHYAKENDKSNHLITALLSHVGAAE